MIKNESQPANYQRTKYNPMIKINESEPIKSSLASQDAEGKTKWEQF